MGEELSNCNTKNKIPFLRKKYSERLNNLLYRDVDSLNQDILDTMFKATSALEKIEEVKKREKEDLNIYKTTTTPAFLWQEEYIASFYLFATMLGYIDKKINYQKRNINFYSKFINSSDNNSSLDEIRKIKNLISKYLLDREKILNAYKTINKNNYDDIILKTLEEQPSYNNFKELYKLDEKSSTQLYIYQHLVSAYNIGYVSEKYDYIKVINYYKKLFEELTNYRNKIELEKGKEKRKRK